MASELERSAGRAQRRGGLSAAAAFLQRAAELTPDPALRVSRSLAAAQAKLDIADAVSASELLTAAELGPVDELKRARLERLRAQIAFASQRGRDAPPLLLEAARRLDPLDAAMARETYLEALASAMFAGRLGTGPDVNEVAQAARRVSTAVLIPGAADLLLDGSGDAVHRRLRGRRGTAVAGAAARSASPAAVPPTGAGCGWRAAWPRICGTTSSGTCSPPGASAWPVTPARFTCSRTRSTTVAALNVHSGAFATAAGLIEEVGSITEATGIPPLRYAEANAGCRCAASRRRHWPCSTGAGGMRPIGARAQAVGGVVLLSPRCCTTAYGHHGEALAVARRACEYEDVVFYGWALVELIEAGVRCGHLEEATEALGRLSERTQASGTEWALGTEARCRALVSDDESFYRESADRLARSRAVVELARSQLVYGEWLRRVNRRGDAREQLRAAHELFSRIGRGWVHRARPARTVRPPVKRCAGGPAKRSTSSPPRKRRSRGSLPLGHTNPEIACPAVHQPPHGRIPPAQGVPEARYQLPQRTPAGLPGRGRRRRARLGRWLSPDLTTQHQCWP